MPQEFLRKLKVFSLRETSGAGKISAQCKGAQCKGAIQVPYCFSVPTTLCAKRAEVSIETTIIFARLLLVALAILLPIALIQTFTTVNIDTSALESDVLIQRLVLSPAGLGYFDPETQEAPLGVIDATKLEAASKNPAFFTPLASYPTPSYAAKITVGSLTAFYNKGLYDDYAPLARTTLPGKGSVKLYHTTIPLIIRHHSLATGDHDTTSQAHIEVISPR